MTDYRFVMGLLVQGYAYRQIEAMAGCSHRAIARARRVLDEEGFTTREQVDGLSLEDIDRLFTDGRKSVVDEFVPVDIERVVAARLGRNKPPVKVLWARYLETDAPAGARFYGYERFCQIVAEHVRVNDLTLPIAHVWFLLNSACLIRVAVDVAVGEDDLQADQAWIKALHCRGACERIVSVTVQPTTLGAIAWMGG